MVVLYYTSTSFLDVVLETIQSLKSKVELHVFIEISEHSKQRGTIVNVANIQDFNTIESPEVVLGEEKWAFIKHYFEGVVSVKFVVNKNKRSISFSTLAVGRKVGLYMRKHKVEAIHFDTISTRCLGIYPYIFNKKVFITFHDPVPHSGETDWRDDLANNLFIPRGTGFFFYSAFAEKLFKQHFSKANQPTHVLRLPVYSIITKMLSGTREGKTILFFGRLSYYKGIDLLLQAIPMVLQKFPHEKFVVAGSASYGYEPDFSPVKQYADQVEFISAYLTTEELIAHIQEAKFVVCPYRDATQSGVLMTTWAAQKMAVVTNVGAFPEYVTDNINGLIAEPTVAAIADKIIESLTNEKYRTLEQTIKEQSTNVVQQHNENIFKNAYKF